MKRKDVQPWRRLALIERLEVRRLLAGIVADFSFESPAEPANSYAYDPGGSVWTFSSTSGVVNSPSSLGAPRAGWEAGCIPPDQPRRFPIQW